MLKSGYTDRSKALQTAIHTFVNDYTWNTEEKQSGAGAIIVVYDNHIYNQDEKSIQVQHEYQDVIGATTHLHLKGDNCLETIMVRGNIKKIKELTKYLSENRGIKSLKLHFMTTF
jgi:CopG family nickel-responsive transcriptional regulator